MKSENKPTCPSCHDTGWIGTKETGHCCGECMYGTLLQKVLSMVEEDKADVKD